MSTEPGQGHLPPFHTNIRKRLAKTPRLYLRDSGLLHSLLGGPQADALLSQPWVGASYEGFVIEQILAELALSRPGTAASFFRTSDGKEVDLVLEMGSEVWAIEIKLSASPSLQDMERLTQTARLFGATRCVLVSQAPTVMQGETSVACPLPWLLEELRRG